MTQENSTPKSDSVSRRTFIQSSGALLGAAALSSYHPGWVHAQGQEVLRVGLVGCGGRGTGAAVNALTADPQAKLVALGDAFADRLEDSHANLLNTEVAGQVEVPAERRFVGFNAYQQVIESCDVVLLATPPHFRPQHIQAAIDSGKHVFAEKPVAVDAPGVQVVRRACEQAKEKRLSVISGLCYRYQDSKQETIQRVHDGAIGDVMTLQCTYNTGALWHRGRKPEWSDMEWQLRNWLYFTWLSGDHVAEQSIHSIDKILWAMKDAPPKKCTASGGRIVRTEEKYGNVFDHFNSTFEWDGGVKAFHSCRQWQGADTDVSDYVWGTQGMAAIQHHRIKGANPWRFKGDACDMYESEMKSLFRSIRDNEPINNGDYMCTSTLMSIMVRMSAYTGKTITWEQATESQEDLTPPAYDWGALAVAPIAQPGVTSFQ